MTIVNYPFFVANFKPNMSSDVALGAQKPRHGFDLIVKNTFYTVPIEEEEDCNHLAVSFLMGYAHQIPMFIGKMNENDD